MLIPCIHQYYPKGGWVFRFASRGCICHPADDVTAEGGQNPRSGARWEPPNSPPPWSTKCSLGAVGHRETMQETESPLWWAAEPLGPRCQGFLQGGGAAKNHDEGQAVRTCCRSVRNFHEVPHRRQGRERNTDHVCMISCQCDCTKSSYNDLKFVQKLSDHPLYCDYAQFLHPNGLKFGI